MGCVYRRAKKGAQKRREFTWYVRFDDVDGRQRHESTDARERRVALRILADRENAVERARAAGLDKVQQLLTPTPAQTFEAFHKAWLAAKTKRLAPGTIKVYGDRLDGHLLPFFGRLGLRDIDAALIEQYITKRLEGGGAPGTVLQEMAILSGIFKRAMRDKLVTMNPVSLAEKPKLDNTILRYLDLEEERTLLAHSAPHLRQAIVFAINTGLREQEQCELLWSDVKTDVRKIIVRKAKSKRERAVDYGETVAKILEGLPRFIGSPYAFTNPETRTKYRGFNNWGFDKAKERSGVENLRWHDLRHTYGSRLAQMGRHLKEIQELMGHASLDMVLRYAHLAPDNRRDAARALDSYYQSEKQLLLRGTASIDGKTTTGGQRKSKEA